MDRADRRGYRQILLFLTFLIYDSAMFFFSPKMLLLLLLEKLDFSGNDHVANCVLLSGVCPLVGREARFQLRQVFSRLNRSALLDGDVKICK